MTTPGVERRETTSTAWAWIGLVLAAFLTSTIVGVVDWFVIWGHSSTCHEAPDPAEARAGPSP